MSADVQSPRHLRVRAFLGTLTSIMITSSRSMLWRLAVWRIAHSRLDRVCNHTPLIFPSAREGKSPFSRMLSRLRAGVAW